MSLLGMIGLDLDTTLLNLFDAASGTIAITAGVGRSSGNGIKQTNVTASAVTKNLAASQATVAIAAGFNIAAIPSGGIILEWLDAGTIQCSVRINADGSVTALRGTATVLGSSAPGVVGVTTQHIEGLATINNTTGSIQVWVNGVSVLNLTGQNTRSSANNSASQVAWSPGANTNVISDLTFGTSQAGDLRVECVMPNGAGSNAQFTPSAGANWQNVDEVPPDDDTTHNDSSTVNQLDTFAHAALTGIPSSVVAVAVQVRGRNTTTGSASMAPVLKSGSTTSVGTTVGQNTTYGDFQTVYLTDPNGGGAWTPTAVNATEIGYKKIT